MRARVAKLALAAVRPGRARPPPRRRSSSRVWAGPAPSPTRRRPMELRRPVKVTTLPQTVTLPNHPEPAIRELSVRAAHNGGWLAFLIEWADPTHPTASSRQFGDQVAVELPVEIKADHRRP